MRHIPNTLTRLRMVLLPAYLFFLYQALFHPSTESFWWGFGALFILGMTDLADGYLAKRNNGAHKSPWGAKWDPIADKLMFWTSVPILWAWMMATAVDCIYPLLGLVVVVSVGLGFLEHARLDILSTRMRAVSVDSAKLLGRLKFNLDLLAIAAAIFAALRIEQGHVSKLGALIVVGLILGTAIALAKINVRQRQAALTV